MINHLILAKLLGHASITIGALMAPSLLAAACFREWGALVAFLESMAASACFGFFLLAIGKKAKEHFYQREALGFVGISWILAAGLGALPFIFGGVLGPVDAYFESMSGFTTTGSSVFGPVEFETTPKSIMFWRSFTHWLGGMGIIVLFLAILPYLSAGGKHMYRSESPGPDPRGLRPRIRDTAAILYTIYLGITVAQTACLMLAGLNLYEALCQTFGTLATGGFSTRVDSIAGFHSLSVEIIITVFTIAAGANFALHFDVLQGKWRSLLKDTEFRAYIAILAIGSIVVALNLLGAQASSPPGVAAAPAPFYHSIGGAFRHAVFQVVTIMSTTGFCTTDFDQWPGFSRMFLVVIMFVGGCAGSTGGGLKVVRVVMLAKMAYWLLESTFHPKTVRALRINGEVVDEGMQRMAYGFFLIYIGWFVLGCLVMSFLGLPFQGAVTSVAATLNNVGPGLDVVGPATNFAAVHPMGKLFLSLCMVLGRLELFSICALFMPSFWRSH